VQKCDRALCGQGQPSQRTRFAETRVTPNNNSPAQSGKGRRDMSRDTAVNTHARLSKKAQLREGLWLCSAEKIVMKWL
jgi:hypothetical protein